jgi:nucleotide-binding universal stress UspA family protein
MELRMKELLSVFAAVPGDTLGHAAMYAIDLAKATGAHLTALIAEREPVGTAPRLEADTRQIDTTVVTSPNLLAKTADLFRAAATLNGVKGDALLAASGSDGFRERLIGCAQVRDLTVFDVQGPLRHPMLNWVEAVLFGSGRPLVLAPAGARPMFSGRVLFAWDASRSAVRALHDMLPLVRGAHEVIVVSVVDDKEIYDPQSGEQICSYLARWGIGARFHPIRRGSEKIGLLLLDFAKRLGAEVIVMGGFGHSREREFIFGSATRDVFQSRLEIPVFLSH